MDSLTFSNHRADTPGSIEPLEYETGVEPEHIESDGSDISEPFNPEKIQIHTAPIVVNQLVDRIEYDEIDLAPDFQRLSGIWSRTNQSRLIESLLLKIPLPAFYVSADAKDHWRVVDGVQRMSVIHSFVTDGFKLRHLEYLHDFNFKKYSELPRPFVRRISQTQLWINIIQTGTPDEVMFNIFRRINTGGTPLNGQEIRHALNPGPVRDYLRRLATCDEFLLATDRSINTKRMHDRECVLRFLAFFMSPPEDYRATTLDSYLLEAMRKINETPREELDQMEYGFKTAMVAAREIFGEAAFRRSTSPDRPRSPVNKPLFEAWSVALARYSEPDLNRIVAAQEVIRGMFSQLMDTNERFVQSISSSTGTPKNVNMRFNAIVELLRRVTTC